MQAVHPLFPSQGYTQQAMNRLPVLALAFLVVGLAAVAPAAALSGEGITAKLAAPGVSAVAAGKSTAKTHTCQAGDTKEKARSHSALVGTARKTAVVACEQPPRSELLGSGLKQAAANALAALG
jgi:hypothetical protein